MNMKVLKQQSEYSEEARELFQALDRRVAAIFEEVQKWRGWTLISSSDTPKPQILALVREIFRSVVWYQSHTTEAGFHMFGRLPKHDVKLIQALCCHKAEEAEHGVWAREDHGKVGGSDRDALLPPSPATFAVAAVWWRMAMIENPLGYLGAEYLFEQLTALVTQAALPVIERRDLPREGLRFVIEHATEDAKHAVFLKHLILDVVTRYPASGEAMLRCFDYFHAVYPLPVWDEAFERAARDS
ncbi:iron-containing redox enzyme family protein (plasmid) [Rhizobium sp. CB3171]|uniref:iron-containing redox enzyme family protein n=1 Tax=Rhizobium sp. CB3171 TaxID=3039157 RepID=UPI0024B10582|nr:iron-containing redox enzyme family protein [Rhizobium sp. CB3171]WFU07442.1 iron-containing redox enzyme family protein [Rhizobium sp. CB3171]